MSHEKWFYRGRDARRLGLDRVITDGRMSALSRQHFYAGWDEENRMRNPPTAAQVEESHRVAAKLKDFARTLKGATP